MSQSNYSGKLTLSLYVALCMTTTIVIADENKNATVERLTVQGSRHQAGQTLSVFNSRISPAQTDRYPVSITDLVTQLPGIDFNGQGGLFQVYSLRGASRWRVSSTLNGMKITTDRRAGTNASFIDPFFIESIDIVKGPQSALYGQGAIGGAVDMTTATFDGFTGRIGYESDSGERIIQGGWGNEFLTVGLSSRTANNTESPNGTALFSEYQQQSALVSLHTDINDYWTLDFSFVPTTSSDIGKANNDDFINTKKTQYPEESHVITQINLTSEHGWQIQAGLHNQQLDTEVTRYEKRINETFSSARDHFLSLSKSWSFDNQQLTIGSDLHNRQNVSVIERVTQLSNTSTERFPILEGDEKNHSVFATWNGFYDQIAFSAGGRYSENATSNPQNGAQTLSAASGFAAVVYNLSSQLDLTASLGYGVRFPTLSERYFDGTTGRGKLTGNPALEKEKATNYEVGMQYRFNQTTIKLAGFYNDITDYIERINLTDEHQSFENRDSGYIQGIEFALSHQWTDSLSIDLSGHKQRGMDNNNQPLADVSPARLSLTTRWDNNDWTASMSFNQRFGKNDIADGEQILHDRLDISGKIAWFINDSTSMTVWLNNLTDEQWHVSADDKSALNRSRHIGLMLEWKIQ